jgi:excisionase family DNA binding protein
MPAPINPQSESEITLPVSGEVLSMFQQFYSVAQAAKTLNVAKLTVYRRTATGEIPSTRMGRKVLIPVAYIETLVTRAMTGAQHTAAPEPQGA